MTIKVYMTQVRTRFAPSPTGFLHIGGARTALFSWAFARHHQGKFILRVEDTDVARSTPEAVQAILDGMAWLGLTPDEGPFYQMQRMERYKEVVSQMLESGHAYRCYTSREELDELRAQQEARKEKPRYDGRWRPEEGKELPPIPSGVEPVIRFRNPKEGLVAWDDQVKGRIEFNNAELDDLIIARADGTPTYNFCVVVDDWDMGITHVIRGDDHVNNTPRQINILSALGAQIPTYAHLSMILGDDGQKLSKRHGAVSVMQYDDEGFLPEAVINYLARLGWSHGNDEIFTRDQLVEWFNLEHITASAAQFNTEKLRWLNSHYIKNTAPEELLERIRQLLMQQGITEDMLIQGPSLLEAIRLYQDRSATLNELANAISVFYQAPELMSDLLEKHVTPQSCAGLKAFIQGLPEIENEVTALGGYLKHTLTGLGMKMPQLAVPLRIALTGQAQAPSVDALLHVFGPTLVIERVNRMLEQIAIT